jgi:peptide/nickel transport system permease protein
VILLTLLAPWVAPNDPVAVDLARRLEPPSWPFPLGTDRLGRCVLSRTMAGASLSLGLSVTAALVVSLVAVAVASVVVFGDRRFGGAVLRAVDALIAFPSFILALAIVGVVGPSAWAAAAAIAWAWWPAEARVVRALLASARQQDYVAAAWLSGVHPVVILSRHVLPQIGPALAVRASLEVGSIVLGLSTLGFLGLGAQPPAPEWGAMLNDARPFVTTAPHLWIGPGAAVIASVLACNLVAEGLRGRLDARQASEW